MYRSILYGAVGISMMLSASQVHAQSCLGLPAAKKVVVNAEIGQSFGVGVSDVHGAIGLSGSKAFVSTGLSQVRLKDLDMTAGAISVDGGLVLPLDASERTSVCSYFSGSYTLGPDIQNADLNFKSRQLGGSAGLAIGSTATVGSIVSVTPFVGAGALGYRTYVNENGSKYFEMEVHGAVVGGIGLHFNEVLTVRGAATVPFGFPTNNPSYSISTVIRFRGGRN